MRFIIKSSASFKVYLKNMSSLKGKVAIVTGASAGIGAATAIKLANSGIKVIALARRIDKLHELEKQVTDPAGKIYPLQVDLRLEDEIVGAFQWIIKNIGAVDFLINNAGVLKFGSILDESVAHYKDLLDTNLIAYCITSREFYELCKKFNTLGHIVNIVCISTKLPYSNDMCALGFYPVTKHGVNMLGISLRNDFIKRKANIKVTNLHPGVVKTDMPNYDDYPYLEAENIADTIRFVLSTPPSVTITDLTVQHTKELLF